MSVNRALRYGRSCVTRGCTPTTLAVFEAACTKPLILRCAARAHISSVTPSSSLSSSSACAAPASPAGASFSLEATSPFMCQTTRRQQLEQGAHSAGKGGAAYLVAAGCAASVALLAPAAPAP